MRTLGWPSAAVTSWVPLIFAGSDTRAAVLVETSRWPELKVPSLPPRARTPPAPSATTAPAVARRPPPMMRPVRLALAGSYVGVGVVIWPFLLVISKVKPRTPPAIGRSDGPASSGGTNQRREVRSSSVRRTDERSAAFDTRPPGTP